METLFPQQVHLDISTVGLLRAVPDTVAYALLTEHMDPFSRRTLQTALADWAADNPGLMCW